MSERCLFERIPKTLLNKGHLPVPVHLQNLSWASLWKWAQLLLGSPPEFDGMYPMQCWSTPMQLQTKTKENIYTEQTGQYKTVYYKMFSPSAPHTAHTAFDSHCLLSLVGSCTAGLLRWHNEETYLQRAVFSSLQKLNKALHHPCSGNDFINGWVGFWKRHAINIPTWRHFIVI